MTEVVAPPVSRLSDAEFVERCLDSKSAEEVAKKVGLKAESVNARIGKLRKDGVEVPKFARKKRVTEVDKLNAIIKRRQQQAAEAAEPVAEGEAMDPPGHRAPPA